MRCARPFDDRRLADARLADEHGIVLRAARQHLDDAADLLVAADDGIELSLARGLGEIAREALERLVLVLGILVGHAVRAPHLLEGFEQRLAVGPNGAQQREALRFLDRREREQQVLGADVLVLERLGLFLGLVEHLIELAGERRVAAAALLGIARSLLLDLGSQVADVRADLLQERNDDPFFLAEQGEEQVAIVDEGIAGAAGEAEGFLDGIACFDGELVGVEHSDV